MRAQSRNSVTDESSENLQMENELCRLRRSYRVMQNDYRAYKEHTQKNVSKQDHLIEELQREREEIDTVLSNMESTQNKGKDEQNARKLRELSECEKEHQAMIHGERTKIRDLDSEILQMESKIAEQRQQMGGTHNTTNKFIALEKRRAVLENRLDKAVVHFNRQLAINSKLREEIEHYRREHSVFQGLYKRLSKELNLTKTNIAEVIKASTQAFEQRDEAKGKMNALKERNEKDQKQHDTEMKELQRIISHDNKMKEFMCIKTNDRAAYKAEEAIKKKRHEKSMDADQIFMNNFEQAFTRIRDVTGLHDITEIVENFVTNEDENFALFNYVNELNCEAELLHEEVSQVTKHINEFKGEDQDFTLRHDKLMSTLEKNYVGVQKTSIASETRLKEVNKVLDHLRHGIEKLFTIMDCDRAPLKAMLGCDSGISNKNAMIYVGQIEHRTTQLLHSLHYLKQKKQELEGIPILKDKTDKTASLPITASLNILAPSWVDIDANSETEDELRPFTQAELRQRINRDLERKTGNEILKEPPVRNETSIKKDSKRKKDK